MESSYPAVPCRSLNQEGELELIRLVGQLDLATPRTDVSLDPAVLHEFGVAGPAHPADRPTHGPRRSGLWPGPTFFPAQTSQVSSCGVTISTISIPLEPLLTRQAPLRSGRT